MSDLKLLKERIWEEGTTGKILEELGCDCIDTEQQGSLLVARAPNSSNKRAVQVKLSPTLPSHILNRGIDGDIYTLIGHFLYDCKNDDEVKSHLYQIKQWIVNTLEYDDFVFAKVEQKPKTEWNSWLKQIKKQRTKDVEVTENKVLDNSILKLYEPIPHLLWINDGISYQTQMDFQVSYDLRTSRIVFPIHSKKGELIGVKGRYVGSDERIMDDQKYMYLFSCSKSIELFNLHRALPYINMHKECIIVEGAKTVMLLWEFGFRNVVSIEGDKLSPVQAKLLKDLGLDIDLLFSFDKDKSMEHVLQQTKQIKNRKKFALFDDEGMFSGKESPADKGKEAFEKLYGNRKNI
jgi:DNA primase